MSLPFFARLGPKRGNPCPGARPSPRLDSAPERTHTPVRDRVPGSTGNVGTRAPVRNRVLGSTWQRGEPMPRCGRRGVLGSHRRPGEPMSPSQPSPGPGPETWEHMPLCATKSQARLGIRGDHVPRTTFRSPGHLGDEGQAPLDAWKCHVGFPWSSAKSPPLPPLRSGSARSTHEGPRFPSA